MSAGGCTRFHTLAMMREFTGHPHVKFLFERALQVRVDIVTQVYQVGFRRILVEIAETKCFGGSFGLSPSESQQVQVHFISRGTRSAQLHLD